MEAYQQKMAQARDGIDSIDRELIPLLVKRLGLSKQVAALKQEYQQPVFDAGRETEILRRVRSASEEDGDFIAAVYASILSSSRAKQHLLLAGGKPIRELEQTAASDLPQAGVKVLCQGTTGAYSHQAARLFFKQDCIDFCPTWEEVFSAIAEQRADFGVVPVENSSAGAVNDVYSLLMKYRFFVAGAAEVCVNHCLAAQNENAAIQKVISHPQGLSQCSEFIRQNRLDSEAFSNTALAAKFVAEQADSSIAAICSEEAAKTYGLHILRENVQNTKNNTTRFVLISRRPYLPRNAHKISLCFALPHVPGSLSGILAQFAMQELNLTKIESRPIPEKKFEYDFYLDFTGNLHDPNTLNLICSLHDELPRFSFLGNYVEIMEE